eukprot:CAMPEP_0171459206 /NCGR_PEP_ID=MMETSP0945-20130129/4583_1 /TAXON_ID=109269 /ORGANISM="Vaucheria litorea, Strain CCMP2940" /LENGTH=150 /DNA_ID=CAMNT_0011985179 /DNA_START=117 /DNA_END=569 /DNA_ORIENTATION=-
MNWPVKPDPAILELRIEVGKINSELSKYTKPPSPIDWKSYEAKMKDPSFVEIFKRKHEKDLASFEAKAVEDFFNVPETEAAFSVLIKNTEPLVEKSREEIRKLEEELSKLKKLYTTRETTVDEVLDAYPELRQQIDEEIANHEWEKGVVP